MPLNELLSSVDQLSHQDKLRLIHHLLLQVAQEDGCPLTPLERNALPSEVVKATSSESTLLNQLETTTATVWSPQTSSAGVQALADLLVVHPKVSDA